MASGRKLESAAPKVNGRQQSTTRDRSMAGAFWTPTLLAIIAIGAVLRLRYLTQPIRYDEAVTYMYFAGKPWATALGSYQYPNNHVFHTALVKLATLVFGNVPWAIRLPAFLAGMAMIPAAFAVGRRTVGVASANLGAALVAASGVLTLYSTNGRGYTMVSLATLLLVLLLLRVRERFSMRDWVMIVVVAALGLWTIPIMLYPAGGAALWFALSALRGDTAAPGPDRRRIVIAVTAAGAMAALLYAPIISRSGVAPLVSNGFVKASPWATFVRELAKEPMRVFSSWTLGLPMVLGLLLVTVTAVGIVMARRTTGLRVSLTGVTYAWCALLLLLMHRVPFTRVWLFLVAPAALLAAHGVVRIVSWRWTTATEEQWRTLAMGIAAVLVGATILSRGVAKARDTGTLIDAEAITRTLGPVIQHGDRVLAPIPSNAPLQYAFLRAGLDTSVFSPSEIAPARVFLVINKGEGQTLETPIADRIIQLFVGAQLVGEYREAELYRLVRPPEGK